MADEERSEDKVSEAPLSEQAVDFVVESAETVSDPKAQAERERIRQRDEAMVASEKAKRDQMAHTRPASLEFQEGSTAAEALGPEVARYKDASTTKMAGEAQRQGCLLSRGALIGMGFGVAVLIAIVILVLRANDDDKKVSSTTGAPAGGAQGGGTEDLTSFAGHYVLVTGLDNPANGDAVFIVSPGAYDSVTPGAGSASFDVDDHGNVSGGEYHASYRATKPDIDCTFNFDATGGTGSVHASGAGAAGQVTWSGTLTISGDNCTPGYPGAIARQIGIVGTDVVMCGSDLDPGLKQCKVPQAFSGTFAKQG